MPHFIAKSTQVVAKDDRARRWVLSAQEYIPFGWLLGQTISLSVNQQMPNIKWKSKISQRYIIPTQIYFTGMQSILSDMEAFYLPCRSPTACASPFSFMATWGLISASTRGWVKEGKRHKTENESILLPLSSWGRSSYYKACILHEDINYWYSPSQSYQKTIKGWF